MIPSWLLALIAEPIRRATTSGVGLKIAACLFLVPVCQSGMAFAQMTPPPPHNSRTTTGVSYQNGAFSFEEEDLSAAGGLPNGLKLTRSYNSGTDVVLDPHTGLPVGWTHNFVIYITSSQVPHTILSGDLQYPTDYKEVCVYSVTGGASSVQFATGGGETGTRYGLGCGGNVPGTYAPVVATGQKLEFLTSETPNHWRFTNSDGSVIDFTPSGVPRASVWTMPDGTRLDFSYDSNTSDLKSVFSNHGWAVLFEEAVSNTVRYCIVNTAQTYLTPTSTCPANAQAATYSLAPGVYNPYAKLLTAASVGGNIRTYEAASNDHVGCIKDPGQTACRIQNTYGHCPEDLDVAPSGIQPTARLHDPVTTQQDASGRSYTYSYETDFCPMSQHDRDLGYPDYSYWAGQATTIVETGISGSTHATAGAGILVSITDPLGHETTFSYDTNVYAPDGLVQINAAGELTGITFPEQNQLSYGLDERGNQTSATAIAKPNSGLGNVATSSSFPVCDSTNVYFCNKPSSVTDARGNVTSYAYDPNHGGVLTETLPGDSNGVHPVKRYNYVHRSAWLANGSGGYSASPYPIWLLSEMRTCRTSATVNNACAGGSSDEVVTTYDYGPESGPNNLLLRGLVVTADGTSRRTCYGYDRDGDKISETKPNANLAVCP